MTNRYRYLPLPFAFLLLVFSVLDASAQIADEEVITADQITDYGGRYAEKPQKPKKQEAGVVADAATEANAPTTTVETKEVTRGLLKDEVLGIKPQAGAVVFNDLDDNTTSRLIAGITVDTNFVSMITKDRTNFFVGPSTGVLYSHLGTILR